MRKRLFFFLFPAFLGAQKSPFSTTSGQPIFVSFNNGSSKTPPSPAQTDWKPLAFTSTVAAYQVSAISYSNPKWLQIGALPQGAKDCTNASPATTVSGTSASFTVCYRYSAPSGLEKGSYPAFIIVKPDKGAAGSPYSVRLELSVTPPSYLKLYDTSGNQLGNSDSKTVKVSVLQSSFALSPFSAVGVESSDQNGNLTAAPFTVEKFIDSAGSDAPWVTVTLPSKSQTTGTNPRAMVDLSINAAANCQADLSATIVFNLPGTDKSGAKGSDYLYLVQDAKTIVPCVLPLAFSTVSPLDFGMPNAPYSQMLNATGGTSPYAWTLFSGQLPPNLSLSRTGLITGTPTVSGSFTFTIQVEDKTGKTMMQAFTLNIASALAITSAMQLAPASVGTSYSQQLNATGGTLPYKWALTNGRLPLGLNLTAGGVVSGATSNVGDYTFAATVTDSNNVPTSQNFSLSVLNAVTVIQAAALAHFAAGDTYVTAFYVFNKSAQSAQFLINFFGNDGTPVILPIAGQAASAKLSAALPANGSAYYEVGNSQSPLVGGWGQLIADPAIVVQALFRKRSNSGAYYEAAVPSTTGSNAFQIPFDATVFAPTGEQLYTGFAIANMDATRSANVTCTARDTAGNVIPNAITWPTLNPLGHYADYIFRPLMGYRGTLDCTSNTLIGVVALRFIGDNTVSSLPVILK